MSTDIRIKLQTIVDKIVIEFKPEKIILFGSYAWGDPTPNSDIDLFIIKDTLKTRLQRGQEVEGILFGSKVPTDILVYTPEEVNKRLQMDDFFIKSIMTKGKLLYALK